MKVDTKNSQKIEATEVNAKNSREVGVEVDIRKLHLLQHQKLSSLPTSLN